MLDTPLEARLRAHHIVHPIYTVEVCKRGGYDLAQSCAMLTMETSGGWNEFGHDGGYPGHPANPVNGGWVNHERYALMRQHVREGCASQGVGPCQLTSTGLQDEADALGGCWLVEHNMAVGFHDLKQLIAAHGEQAGFAAYNGSGPAAEIYGHNGVLWTEHFRAIIN